MHHYIANGSKAKNQETDVQEQRSTVTAFDRWSVKATTDDLNSRHSLATEEGGIDQVVALVIGDDVHASTVGHHMLGGTDDSRRLATAEKSTHDMQIHANPLSGA